MKKIDRILGLGFLVTQIIPFGSEIPSKKEGFTATESITKKVYNLSELSKKDYDLVFIDISGKEVKYPIVIK